MAPEIILGEQNPDGTIKELGRFDGADTTVDILAEFPAYGKAVKRGTNVCFASDDKELVAQLEENVRKREAEAAAATAAAPPAEASVPAPAPDGESRPRRKTRAEA